MGKCTWRQSDYVIQICTLASNEHLLGKTEMMGDRCFDSRCTQAVMDLVLCTELLMFCVNLVRVGIFGINLRMYTSMGTTDVFAATDREIGCRVDVVMSELKLAVLLWMLC